MLKARIVLTFFHIHSPTFANQKRTLAEARTSSSFKDTKHSLFVMLRRYRGLQSGYSVTSKAVSYKAFKLSLTFREAPPDESSAIMCNNTHSMNSSMLFVISATPVKSVYKSKSRAFVAFVMTTLLTFPRFPPSSQRRSVRRAM